MIADSCHQYSVSDDQQMLNMICIIRQSLQKQTSSEAQNVPGIPGPSHSRLMRITNIYDDDDGDENGGEGGDDDGEEDRHVQGPASLIYLAEAKRQKIPIHDDLICIKFLFQILNIFQGHKHQFWHKKLGVWKMGGQRVSRPLTELLPVLGHQVGEAILYQNVFF